MGGDGDNEKTMMKAESEITLLKCSGESHKGQ